MGIKEQFRRTLHTAGLLPLARRVMVTPPAAVVRRTVGPVSQRRHRKALQRQGCAVTTAAGHRMDLDPQDGRAVALFHHGGVVDSDAARTWRLLVDAVNPQTVIDVGANYGEIILAADYPAAAAIVAVEPNPHVFPLLQRSLQRAFGSIATVHQVAAASSNGTVTLNVDRRSSGVTSMVTRRPGMRRCPVPSQRLDSLVSIPRRQRLLFKIDVEGAEPAVLAGLRGLRERASDAVGLCELHMLTADQRRRVADDWHVYATRRGADGLVRLDVDGLERVFTRYSMYDFAKDAVLATDRATLRTLEAS